MDADWPIGKTVFKPRVPEVQPPLYVNFVEAGVATNGHTHGMSGTTSGNEEGRIVRIEYCTRS